MKSTLLLIVYMDDLITPLSFCSYLSYRVIDFIGLTVSRPDLSFVLNISSSMFFLSFVDLIHGHTKKSHCEIHSSLLVQHIRPRSHYQHKSVFLFLAYIRTLGCRCIIKNAFLIHTNAKFTTGLHVYAS